MLGFGVFKVIDKVECKQVVLNVICIGYCFIDIVVVYDNEDVVGEVVCEVIVEGLCICEVLFIIFKLWVQDMVNIGMVKVGIVVLLKKLGLEYFDFYLLYQVMGDYFSVWCVLEEVYEVGILKVIGVFNFYFYVLVNFCEIVRIKLMVNQVELYFYFVQFVVLEVMKYYYVQFEVWVLLGGGRYNLY